MACAVALDFETSDKYADSACALGMVRIEDMHVVSEWYSLIRPPRSRVYFTEIHGLTWDMLKNEKTFGQLWPEMEAFLQGADLMVAHNASFDRRVLCGSCRAYGFTPPPAPFACTVKGSRIKLRLPHHRLNDVCSYLGLELNHHNAASDAMAAARIYLYLRSQGMTDEEMLIKEGQRAMRRRALP